MKEITSVEEYKENINKLNTVVIYSADWCGDCVYLDSFIDDIVKEYEDKLNFIKVNTDIFIDIVQDERIMGIPSLVSFKEGQRVNELINKNRKTPEEITNYLNQTIENL